MRRYMLASSVLFLAAFHTVVPGLLGTLRSLFANYKNDPSVQGRTSDYTVVFHYLGQRPWFGRGPGTFIPSRYIVLDNQILGQLVSLGVIGLAALILLFVTALAAARWMAKSPKLPEEDRHLAAALAATVAAGFVTSFTFDSLAFPIFAGTLFLAFGAIGALWRLKRTTSDTSQQHMRFVRVSRRHDPVHA